MVAEAQIQQGYKMTEVGEIPVDWEVTSLEKVLSFGSGQDYKHLKKGDVPVYGTGGIMTFVDDWLYEGESVGIGRKGTIDKPVFLKGKFWTVDTLFYTLNFRNTLPKYIYYKFLTIKWKDYNEASGVPSLNKNTLGKIQIPLPPTLAEQEAIATALSDVDAYITQLDQLITKKKAIKQGAMQELLNKKVEWKDISIAEILSSTQLGGNYVNDNNVSNYPLMKMGNIQRGYISLNKIAYVSEPFIPEEMDRLNSEDLLFNTRNTLDLVGKVSVWRDELPVAYFNSNLMRLSFNTHYVASNVYMNAVLNSSTFISKLKGIATGTTSVAAIYTRDLLKLEVSLVSRVNQKKFAQILSDMDAELEALEQKRDKYKNIKQGMMQQLLTGRVRLV